MTKKVDWKEVKRHHEMYTKGSGGGSHGYPDAPRIYELLLDINERLEKLEKDHKD